MSSIASKAEVERLLVLALEQTREHALVLLDAQGTVVGWFGGATSIFGYTAEEMLGQAVDRLFTPEERERGIPAHELHVARSSGRAIVERWLVRQDGSQLWASGSTVSLLERDGHLAGFVKVLRDRTDVKAQIEALERRVEALGNADRRKTLFLATLAHELRNALTPQMSALELLRLDGPPGAQAKALRMLERQLELMRRLVDDLLDVSRLSAGKVGLSLRRLDLNEVLQRSCEMVRPAYESRRQQVHLLLLPTPIELPGDPDRLLQVFVNLFTNAVKYTPTGGQVWVRATVEGDEAVVRVEDTGIGIDPEMLPRIFELFTQQESARQMAEGGLGLGLPLVRDLVSMHGGTVQVRSEGRDKGSEFTVRLPLAATQLDDLPAANG